jgi:transposase
MKRIYRVELELHSHLLGREKISTLDDFEGLIDVIYPKHFQFVEVDWRRLRRHLKRKRHGKALIAGAQKRGSSLSRLRRYLLRSTRRSIVHSPGGFESLRIHHAVTRLIQDVEEAHES